MYILEEQELFFYKNDFGENERYPKKASIFQNPFKINVDGTRDEVLEKYSKYIKEKLKMTLM